MAVDAPETATIGIEPSVSDVSPSVLEPIGLGGGSEVFRIRGSDDVALKRYRATTVIDWNQIAYQTAHPVERHSHGKQLHAREDVVRNE